MPAQKSPEDVLKALEDKGISREDLVRAFEKDDPVVITVRCIIPRQEGCPVHLRSLRKRDVDKLPKSLQRELELYAHEKGDKADERDEDGRYVKPMLDVSGLHFEDIRRALAAL